MNKGYRFASGEGKSKKILIIVIICLVVLCIALGVGIWFYFGKDQKDDNNGNTPSTSTPSLPSETAAPLSHINEDALTIETRFNVPEGYTRVPLSAGSFGEYLRKYNLKTYGSAAYEYDDTSGSMITNEEAFTEGVLSQPVTLNRWQQCADTAIMFWAEYLYENKQYDKISFDFLNGFKCDFNTWASGKRIKLEGNDVVWVEGGAEDDSFESLAAYLNVVYQYANTDSLAMQFSSVPRNDMSVGDIFVATKAQLVAAAKILDTEKAALAASTGQTYTPIADTIKYGHAIVVVDMAVNEQTGEKIFMLAEGNTPATEPYVVMNPDESMGAWFKLDEAGAFVKSELSGLSWSSAWLRRFS